MDMEQFRTARIGRSFLAVEWGLFLYVVIGFAASHLLPLPEIAKSVLSLPAWLIIPYFFGSCCRLALRRLRFNSFLGHEVGLFSLLFGIYLLIVVTFLLDLLGLSIVLVNLYLLVLGVAFIYLIYKTFRKVGDDFPVNAKMCRTYIPIFVFCVLVSMIPAMMKVSVSPFPYGTVETISIPFEQYQPALRFMEFGYLQHPRVYDFVSLGFCSQLFNIDPLSFIWAASFLMMAIFSFGLYLFSYCISKSKGFAFLTVFIGSFLNMNVFRDIPLLFRGIIFLYVFLPFVLYLSYKNVSKKEYRMKDVVIALVFFSAVTVFYIYLLESNIWSAFVPKNLAYPLEWRSHVWLPTIVVSTAPVLLIMGCLSKIFIKKNSFLADNALLLMFITFFCLAFQDSESYAFILFIFTFILLFFMTKNKKTRLLLYLFIAFVLAFVIFQHYIAEIPTSNPISSILLPNYASSPVVMPFSLRFNWIFEVNLTLILIVLLVLGIAVSVVSRRKEDIFIISAFLSALLLYLFPETYAYRFYKELSIMMAFVVSLGLWRIFSVFVDLRKRRSTLIFSACLVVLLLPSLLTPVYQRYYQSTLGQSIISDYEYSASKWLRTNTPENSLLISDYETMQLMAPFSNKMLPVDRNYLVEGLSQNDTQIVWRIKNMLSTSFSDVSLEDASKPQFWTGYGFGQGSIDVKTDNASQELNNATLKISVIEGGKSIVGVIHKFAETQNWSNASGLYINWYGENTNITWQICVAAPDDFNWFAFDFIDNFAGWKNISIQFNTFDTVSSPDWADVSYIAVRTSNEAPNSWFIGDVGLSYAGQTLNINYDDFDYLRTHISSTDNRYSEQTGISMKNASILIVLTPRTVQWIQQDGISGITSIPQGPVDSNYLELFKNTASLELIYSYENEIYIFKVK